MKEKLRAYIESLFAEAPQTHRAVELKEELYSNLSAKYDDLIAAGKNEEEAYLAVVSGIGDVEELLRGLRAPDMANPAEAARQRQATGLVVSVSVMLYILSVAALIFLSTIWGGVAGVTVMFVLIAAATGLLVFHFVSRPRYMRQDDTLVEEFKEWQQHSGQQNGLYRSLSSVVHSLAVLIFLILGFFYGGWYYAWIVFVIAAVINRIIRSVMDIRGVK